MLVPSPKQLNLVQKLYLTQIKYLLLLFNSPFTFALVLLVLQTSNQGSFSSRASATYLYTNGV